MAKIVSDAGEITLAIRSFRREGNSIVVAGTMGVWEAKVYLSMGEAMRFITMALSNPALLLSFLAYPFVVLKRHLERGEDKPEG